MPKTPQDTVQETYMHRPSVITEIEVQMPTPVPPAKDKQAFSRIADTAVLLVIDAASLAISLSIAFLARVYLLPAFIKALPEIGLDQAGHFLWFLPISLLCLVYEGLYFKRLSFWPEAKKLTKASTLAFLLMLSVVSLGKMSGEVSRTVLTLSYLLSIFLLPLGRFTGKSVMAKIGLGEQPVLILGAGKTGKLVAQAMLREKFLRYRIVGFLDDDPIKRSSMIRVNGDAFSVLGCFRDADLMMKRTGVRDLIVAAPGMPGPRMVELVNRLQQQADSVTVIPDLFGVPVMGVEADYSFDEQILSFRIHNRLANLWNMKAKRIFDLVVGTIILVAVLPLMVAIATAIKLDSRGPVFFSHKRIGRGGKEFGCYKFRSMAIDAQEILDNLLKNNPTLREEWNRDFKLKHDPRITRVGRFLRKTSLDELPQIFNVLKGEMSLVGPRPIVGKEIPRFSHFVNHYFKVRPGITGLWQVSGRSDIDYPERVRLESWYVCNWSLWLDVTLLIRTVSVVLGKRGAY